MSRGELSDQGNTPTITRCGSVEFSSNFVMTCPLFNSNILRGPRSSVAPSLRYSSRLSSGCYSLDADTGQMTRPIGCDKSTQTPSPACQAIHHAQVALAQRQHLQNCERMEIHEISQPAGMDIAPEVLIGQELRRIADNFNLSYQAEHLSVAVQSVVTGHQQHHQVDSERFASGSAGKLRAPNRRRARAHRPLNNLITSLRHWISILFRR